LDEVEADAVAAGELGWTVAQRDDRFDHFFHRFDLVVWDLAADHWLGPLTHHCGAWFDRVDAHAGFVEFGGEPLGQAIKGGLRRAVDGHRRVRHRPRRRRREVHDPTFAAPDHGRKHA